MTTRHHSSLTHHQVELIKTLVYKYTGITLGAHKDVMIKNRMDKLSRTLSLPYDVILQKVANGELVASFISAYTTNKTDFFREHFHFEDLKERVLPEFFSSGRTPKIYCSASSTGEEPYSIAITCLIAQEKFMANSAKFDILATDIDEEVLARAREGVYAYDNNSHTFPSWVQPAKYFRRREVDGPKGYLIKPKEEILQMVRFGIQNLMDTTYPFSNSLFDVVFCRNVLIYFSQADQKLILNKLFATLKVGGTLYLGHSESPLDLAPYVKRIGQNIFIKLQDAAK